MLGFILLFLRSLLERVCFKFRHGCLLNYKYIIFCHYMWRAVVSVVPCDKMFVDVHN